MWDAAAGRKIRVAFVVGECPPEERKRRDDAALAYSSAEGRGRNRVGEGDAVFPRQRS
jgi:hypothetical protein